MYVYSIVTLHALLIIHVSIIYAKENIRDLAIVNRSKEAGIT